jgi:hypothetical protein
MTSTLNTTELSNLLTDVARFYQGSLGDKVATAFLSEYDLDTELLKRLGAGYSNGTLVQTLNEDQFAALTDFGLIRDGRDAFEGSLVFPCKGEDGRLSGFLGIQVAPPFTETAVLSTFTALIGEEVLGVYRDAIVVATSLLEFLVLQRWFPNIIVVHPELGYPGAITALSEHRVTRVITFGDGLLDEQFLEAGLEVEHRAVRVTTGSSRDDLSVVSAVRKPTGEKPLLLEKHRSTWLARRGALSYRMTGMKAGFTTTLRVSLRAEKYGKPYVDTVDLLSARSRNAFATALAEVTGEEPAVIGQDLFFLLAELEREEEQRASAETESQPLTAEQERLGMTFLTRPDLLDEVVRDLDVLGYTGEAANKQLVFLAAVSRLQDDPLNVLVVSGSGAGKSALIDAVRKLIPPSEVVSLTSLSDQALNYIEPDGLRHRLMILGEAVHSEAVNHALREIVSSKQLSRMVVTRDDRTGQQMSRIITTPAVVSLMMSTTRRDRIDPENMTRYFVLRADESEEQTARIHRMQNSRFSLESLRASAELVPTILEKHHAAQRLLRPVKVIAPEGLSWDLPVHKLRTRRDNQALNNLMASIAFIRQHQKERKTSGGITYIECDEWDRQKAWELFASAVMPSTYREHPEAMTRLYETIRAHCVDRGRDSGIATVDVVFDQKSIRKAVNWMSGESVKAYIRKLVELEFLIQKSSGARGQRKTYSLAEDASWQELEGGANGT